MSSALKRKRPESGGSSKELNPDERNVFNLIKSKGNLGIWKGDIRKELNMTNAKIVDNCVKSLLSKAMIKEVANVQAKGKKRLMAMEFEPSKELTGGVWYQDGILDEQKVTTLKDRCVRALRKQKVATADGIRHEVNKSEGVNFILTVEQVEEILDNLVLEKVIARVKSNRMGEFPINANCYKLRQQRTEIGSFSLIPCGVCTRINHCSPDGVISPVTCKYYKEWLEF